ncbi:MAG: hypothetical protein ACXU87_13390, partial [Xanthobacteraceae bacterium]
EWIVDELAKLAHAGFDGVILSWPRYIEHMRQFQTTTLPLLEQAGLRYGTAAKNNWRKASGRTRWLQSVCFGAP